MTLPKAPPKRKRKYYFAAAFTRREAIKERADEFTAAYEDSRIVSSSWVWLAEVPLGGSRGNLTVPPHVKEKFAKRDLFEIYGSDYLVLFDDDPEGDINKAGMFVEAGYCLRLQDENSTGCRLIVIGQARNAFMTLASEQYDSWEDFLRWHLPD
jgi:hypothetical protein